MHARTSRVVAATALLVGACGGDDATTTADTTAVATTAPAVTLPEVTEPPTTPAPSTTAAPTTEPTPPPTTAPPTTEPPPTVPPTTASPTTEPPQFVCETISLTTGDETVVGERCTPTGPAAARPAAIVLNGCGGYEADADITSASVRALAARGVVGLRIDFLAAEPAPPDTYCEAGPVIGAVQQLLGAVVDGVALLRTDPMVDPDRIGTVSYSLGAIVVLGAQLGGAGITTVEPIGLSAAALLAYPDQLPTILDAARAGQLPPLFLMTGADDTIAPPSGAQALADAAAEGSVPVEIVIVPDQDHPWRGEAAERGAAAAAEFVAMRLDQAQG